MSAPVTPTLATARVIGICCLPAGGWIVRAMDGQQHISRTVETRDGLLDLVREYADARA